MEITTLPGAIKAAILRGETATEFRLLWNFIICRARSHGLEWSWVLGKDQQSKHGGFDTACPPETHASFSVIPIEIRDGELDYLVLEQGHYYTHETFATLIGYEDMRDRIDDFQQHELLFGFRNLIQRLQLLERCDEVDIDEWGENRIQVRHPKYREIVYIHALEFHDPEKIVARAWMRSNKTDRIKEFTFPIADLNLVQLNILFRLFEFEVETLEHDNGPEGVEDN